MNSAMRNMNSTMRKMNPFRNTQKRPEFKTDYTYNKPTTTINPDFMMAHPYVDKQAKHPNNNEWTPFVPHAYKPSGEEHLINEDWMLSHPYVNKAKAQPRPQKTDEDTIASAE